MSFPVYDDDYIQEGENNSRREDEIKEKMRLIVKRKFDCSTQHKNKRDQ